MEGARRVGTADNGATNGNGVPGPVPIGHLKSSPWSLRQLQTVAFQVGLILIVFTLVGLAFTATGSGQPIARTEFVYTLDESVPDSFLREDRRLLTQIATIESDAVLLPVAETFGLEVDELRDRVTIETVDLSEILALDVSDPNPDTALAISAAVIDQYLLVATRPPSTDEGVSLAARRADIIEALARTDAALLASRQDRLVDPGMATTEESLERRIAVRTDQINRLQASLDDSLASPIPRSRRNGLAEELVEAEQALVELESELSDLRTDRATLAAETATESALLRDIDRLEADLATIDAELARRELQPLIEKPIRILGEPTITSSSVALTKLRGPAIALLIALPLAGVVAYRTRKRQLWFGR